MTMQRQLQLQQQLPSEMFHVGELFCYTAYDNGII
jgi:hypothetical protein